MASLPRPGGLADELADLRKRLQILERTSRLQNASIGSGGLVVRDGGSVTIEAPGDLFLTDANGDVIWQASSDAIQIDGGDRNVDGLTVPANWGPFGGSAIGVQIYVPEGFARVQFLMMASVGQTFTSSVGNVSVRPRVTYVGGINDGGTWYGPAVNSGGGSNVAVAQSFWAETYVTGGATALRFGCEAIRIGTPASGQGNWHVAVNTIFKRK